MAYIYAHARFDDLDLDGSSQWIGRKKNQRWIISKTKQVMSITLATTVGQYFFHMTWASKIFIWLDQLVYFILRERMISWFITEQKCAYRSSCFQFEAVTCTPLYFVIIYLRPRQSHHPYIWTPIDLYRCGFDKAKHFVSHFDLAVSTGLRAWWLPVTADKMRKLRAGKQAVSELTSYTLNAVKNVCKKWTDSKKNPTCFSFVHSA